MFTRHTPAVLLPSRPPPLHTTNTHLQTQYKQTAPGKYDEKGLEALDYVLDSANRHGIQLILSFIDNWKYYNGVAQVRVVLYIALKSSGVLAPRQLAR